MEQQQITANANRLLNEFLSTHSKLNQVDQEILKVMGRIEKRFIDLEQVHDKKNFSFL